VRDQKVESPLPGGLPIVPLPGTIVSISLPTAVQVGQEVLALWPVTHRHTNSQRCPPHVCRASFRAAWTITRLWRPRGDRMVGLSPKTQGRKWNIR